MSRRTSGRVASGRGIPHAAVAAAIVVVIQLLHGPAAFFLYDAAQYWQGSVALATGGDAVSAGELRMRGALTPVVYLIPAGFAQLLDAAAAGWIVLAWNALLAAVLCAVVLPRLTAVLVGSMAPYLVYAVAIVGAVVVSGFSRYPLLDVWAVTAALGGVLLMLRANRWYMWAGAGALLVVATNLRPSYLVPVLLAVAVAAVARKMPTLWVLPGAAVALVPQLVVNVAAWGSWSLLPTGTGALTRIQAAQSAYVVRYDTVVEAGRSPQQFYCDPGFAAGLVDSPAPESPLELLMTLLGHLPDSIWFLLQKAAASLAWSLSTPYESSPDGRLGPVSIGIATLAAAGLVALIYCVARPGQVNGTRTAAGFVGAFWLGSLATLVLSTPETRFALPIVLTGLVGTAAVASRAGRPRERRERSITAAVVLGTGLLAAGLLATAVVGLAHAAPPGPLADAAECAALSE
jgi:hypothetical protein